MKAFVSKIHLLAYIPLVVNSYFRKWTPNCVTARRAKISKAQNFATSSSYQLNQFNFINQCSFENHLIHNLTRLRNEFIWLFHMIFQKLKTMVQKLPAQIVGGAKRPSFAFHTVTERWPKIVAGIVDRLHQSYNKTVADHGEVCFSLNLNENPIKNRRKPGRTWTQWSQNCPKCATSSWLTNRWKNSRQKARRMLPFGMGKFKSRARFAFKI